MENNANGLAYRRGSSRKSLRPVLSPKPWTNLSDFGEKSDPSRHFRSGASLKLSPARERKHSWREGCSINVHPGAEFASSTSSLKSKSWTAGHTSKPEELGSKHRNYRKISEPVNVPNLNRDLKSGIVLRNGSVNKKSAQEFIYPENSSDKNGVINGISNEKDGSLDLNHFRLKGRHHLGHNHQFRGRKNQNNRQYDSSSDEEPKKISPRERKTTRFFTPSSYHQGSIVEELNSPVLQKKLQKAISRRSKSKNNFHRRTRKIRVEGCMYKLTMEPANISNSADEEVILKSSPQKPQPRRSVGQGAGLHHLGTNSRSGSVPETQLRKKRGAKLQHQNSYTQKEMLQAQKWVSEREDQARRIDLAKPIRLPPTEVQIGSRNGNTSHTDEHDLILPCVDRREALDCAALRLRRITQEVENGKISPQVMKDTLQYAISVLEMKFLNRTSYSDDDSDADASLQGDSVVPPEIKRWLMQTFSTSGIDGKSKRKGERRTLRSVVHVMQAGMFVERMFRKSSAAASLNIAPEIQLHLRGIDKWRYDVFELENISGGNALKYTLYEVLSKYDFIRKYKISPKSLFAFADRLQIGYKKHNNQYHNPTHAADVTQCISVFLNESGFVNWLSELEVFAMIFAGAIHDLEHTGTTNNFHTQTRSNLALLYNDKSVLENHHVSSAFRILWDDPECDILASLSKDDYKQFRELVIEMVLATDMSLHFGQIKNMKAMLLHPENMERSKAMALMMHCADINHPTRPWDLHHRWTSQLLEEFFQQGDKERELQIPISPLCDRHTTMVAQSQIGFIDYVIKPTFEVLNDLFWKISVSITDEPPGKDIPENTPNGPKSPCSKPGSTTENSSEEESGSRRHSEVASLRNSSSTKKPHLKEKIKEFRKTCNYNMMSNRQKWVEKDEEEQKTKQAQQNQDENSTSMSTPPSQSSTSSDNGSTTT